MHDITAKEWTHKYAFNGSLEEQDNKAKESLATESDEDDESVGSINSWGEEDEEVENPKKTSVGKM